MAVLNYFKKKNKIAQIESKEVDGVEVWMVSWESRHGDGYYDTRRCETIQGFITNKGRFVNRKEAFQIALAAGQIDESAGVGGELFSEDLY